ncbi:MAG: precorrin-6y C5,15-methyltransferase (decarboxylating) subunit CbiE [Paracoccaceae bacterium]
MSDAPWLTIIGLGEDGPDGLAPASQAALAQADVVMGPPRHLDLLPDVKARRVEWPVPFTDGIPLLMGHRHRNVVVLASGDPFWFGAGSVIARVLEPGEWRAFPGFSTFSLAAARLGWPLENTICVALHAAPLTRVRPHLVPGQQIVVLLRDGDAVGEFGSYLTNLGFGDSSLMVLEALGGPRETCTETTAASLPDRKYVHPVCVAVSVDGSGESLPRAAGLPDHVFDTDGQMTKRPVRALTLSALAPRAFETLWDIGGGSGSVAIEWLLAHPTTQAISIEQDEMRAKRIAENAARLGVDRLQVRTGVAPDALNGLAAPDAIFVGGGLSEALLSRLQGDFPGTRLVANGVTLEAEALLAAWQIKIGGELLRIDVAQAQPLGTKRGWRASFPIVQWSVTL